jgi:hypothetical protein
MRIARVNITIPDELLEHARAAGLNVSRLAAAAVAEELDRRAKIAALDACLAELDAELGPIPRAEQDAAAAWADQVTGRIAPKKPPRGPAGQVGMTPDPGLRRRQCPGRTPSPPGRAAPPRALATSGPRRRPGRSPHR